MNGGFGGGGAGLFVEKNLLVRASSTLTVTIGAGGVNTSFVANGANGTSTTCKNSDGDMFLLAGGGGGGGNPGSSDGGCGGGGGRDGLPPNGGLAVKAPGTTNWAFNGGSSGPHHELGWGGAGGGGGSGGLGGNGNGDGSGAGELPGNGGIGRQSSITGVATYYGGGGGAGRYSGSINSTGGLGGGGNGGSGLSSGSNGSANTGSGGGGGGGNVSNYGGNGGSGILIIKILFQ